VGAVRPATAIKWLDADTEMQTSSQSESHTVVRVEAGHPNRLYRTVSPKKTFSRQLK
jgi:hypothetical protein